MAPNPIGWYGPLIDLRQAPLHVGNFVQLLVFVHTSIPIQRFKASKGGTLLRTDIQVGDDTLSFFSVCLWQKQIGSSISAGDVVLLQNVKIVKFGDVIEAATVCSSSFVILVHPHKLLVSGDIDEIMVQCRVGTTTKEKMKKVIKWVQQTGSRLHGDRQSNLSSFVCNPFPRDQRRQQKQNWKLPEERKTLECISILEVSSLISSCNASCYGCIGEIFLPFIKKHEGEFDTQKLFISKRLFMMEDDLVEDFICTGCKLCGSLVNCGSLLEQNGDPLYCQKSSNHLHIVCFIYKPFLLYVWDQSEHIPLLVKNKAAEVLFGNLTAESIYRSYQGDQEKRNFYMIWLVLLKLLLLQGKNSPVKFEITVNFGVDQESGKFELVNLTMPCYRSMKVLE